MKKRFCKKVLKVFLVFIALIFIIISLVSCNLLRKNESAWEKYKGTYVTGGNTKLYQSLKDPFHSEIIEVGTPVKITGRCRKSSIENGEVLCPIQFIHSEKEGWIIKYDLVAFEDYLPANED